MYQSDPSVSAENIPSMPKKISKFSESLALSLTNLHKAGGPLLVFIFVGVLTMTTGNFLGGSHSGVIVAVGAVVTLACLALFSFVQVQGSVRANQDLQVFGELLAGHWWEHITPDDSSALSFVTIEPDSAAGTIKMHGRAFGLDGMPIAKWESIAVCIKLSDKKVFYYWEGKFPKKATASYEGFGQVAFHASAGGIHHADGFFSDTNLENWSTTTRKLVTLRRCLPQEAEIMNAEASVPRSKLIRDKLKNQT